MACRTLHHMVFAEAQKAIHEDDRLAGEFAEITIGDWRGYDLVAAR